jgi:hypothetical protein
MLLLQVAAIPSSRNSGEGPAGTASSCSCSSSNQLQPEALLLAFQRLPDQELYSTVTAVCKPWQAAAAAAFSTRAITLHNIPALSCKAASALAWLARYSSNIRELHLHHAELHPSDWSALLSLPFPKLAKLQVIRCRLGDCSKLQLLGQLANLQHLSLNHVAPQLSPGLVAELGALTCLTGLELKSCGLAGEHLQGLTPLVQSGLCSLDLFDNPGIGKDEDSSNKAVQMWAGTAAAAAVTSSSGAADSSAQQADSEAASATTAATGNRDDAEQATTVQQQGPLAAPAADAAAAAESCPSSIQLVADEDSNQQQQQEPAQEHEQQQQQRLSPMLMLRQLQLSYCSIRHLPQLAQLTSLTSLNLQENKCNTETVQAIGQLQQLQELVLEEAVGAATPPSAFAALAGLTNLELLDISGGPTGEQGHHGLELTQLLAETAASSGWLGSWWCCLLATS